MGSFGARSATKHPKQKTNSTKTAPRAHPPPPPFLNLPTRGLFHCSLPACLPVALPSTGLLCLKFLFKLNLMADYCRQQSSLMRGLGGVLPFAIHGCVSWHWRSGSPFRALLLLSSPACEQTSMNAPPFPCAIHYEPSLSPPTPPLSTFTYSLSPQFWTFSEGF